MGDPKVHQPYETNLCRKFRFLVTADIEIILRVSLTSNLEVVPVKEGTVVELVDSMPGLCSTKECAGIGPRVQITALPESVENDICYYRYLDRALSIPAQYLRPDPRELE